MSWNIMTHVAGPTSCWSRGLLGCCRFGPAAADWRSWALLLFQAWVGRGNLTGEATGGLLQLTWRFIKRNWILWGLRSCSGQGQRLGWTKKGAHSEDMFSLQDSYGKNSTHFNTDKQVVHGFKWISNFVNSANCWITKTWGSFPPKAWSVSDTKMDSSTSEGYCSFWEVS